MTAALSRSNDESQTEYRAKAHDEYNLIAISSICGDYDMAGLKLLTDKFKEMR